MRHVQSVMKVATEMRSAFQIKIENEICHLSGNSQHEYLQWKECSTEMEGANEMRSVMKVTAKRRSALQKDIKKGICDVSGSCHQNEI